LFGQVDHRLWRDLLHGPEVRDVGWSGEAMGCTLFPAVECPFVSTHKVLPGQHRVLFVPDNRLAEVEAARLQCRRIVRAVGIAAPDVERPATYEHATDVPEPGQEHPLERLVGYEVVQKWAVLRPHFPRRCPLRLMALQVEALVMLGARERGKAG